MELNGDTKFLSLASAPALIQGWTSAIPLSCNTRREPIRVESYSIELAGPESQNQSAEITFDYSTNILGGQACLTKGWWDFNNIKNRKKKYRKNIYSGTQV